VASVDEDGPGRGVALVTGAGSGIGAATVQALAADGWSVVLAGRRMERLQAVRAQTIAAGIRRDRLLPVAADVTDELSVRALFAETVREYGRVDLLVNNAGVGSFAREPADITLTEWQQVLAVNVTGTFLCTREAFKLMRDQDPQGGRIINNGSISAQTPRPRSMPYTAAKHAVTGITKTTALDGRPYRIACGQIDIGNAATEMTEPMSAGVLQADGEIRPEPRMDVAHAAEAVRFMASLPLESNVLTMTVMATAMPYVGRG
jgi:NAD(P)-dependent dehydrogenase (short-subunit alcohol dehydrogenase family)